jgi:hypothetical protein
MNGAPTPLIHMPSRSAHGKNFTLPLNRTMARGVAGGGIRIRSLTRNELVFVNVVEVFTARYGLIPYVKQITFSL